MKTFSKGITKEAMLAEVEKHRKADQIAQGTYGQGQGDDWKGCAVGCSIHSINVLKNKRYATNRHSVYETELGIPEWLARLEDTIFEGLPTDKAKLWPGRFIKAIPEGVDLDPVKWQFCAYLMKQNIARVLALDIADDLKQQVVKAIRDVLAVHELATRTGYWDESAAQSAWSAAQSAESAAQSAAESARSAQSAAQSARSAAWSAQSARSAQSAAESAWFAQSAARSAQSAAQSARSAAWSAESAWFAQSAAQSAQSAAESAWFAQSAAYVKHSKRLLSLLRASGKQVA